MQWNRKWIGICLTAFILLAGILLVKGIQTVKTEQPEMASEEEFVIPSLEGSASGGAAGTVAPDSRETSGGERADRKSKADGKKGQEKTKPTQTVAQSDAGAPGKASKTALPGKNTKTKEKTKKAEQGASPKKALSKKTAAPAKTAKPAVTTKPLEKTENTVTFQIHCKRIMNRRDLWKNGIEEIIPSSGVFYSGTYRFRDGDTAYDILKEICRKNNIALDSQYTPMYKTYYIRGIGNLYEFDCGQESGWKYSVNDKLPGVGCSGYPVKSGDKIIFFYDYQY